MKRLKLARAYLQRTCHAVINFSVYRLAEKSLNISSTVLRARQRRGQALQDVPDAVADFFGNIGNHSGT